MRRKQLKTARKNSVHRAITQHETLVLSDRDRQAFFEALVNPPDPTEQLMRALAKHRCRVVS
jgi:uncharacterized protein (DUF1778 family)